jgi:hypothetical protein
LAWTVPKTWVAAEIVDEAEMNTHLRDNLNYLNDLRIKWAQRTTNTSAFSAETDLLTAPSFTPINASRVLLVHVHVWSYVATVTSDIFLFRIKEGGTQFTEISKEVNVTGQGVHGFTMLCYITSPSAAAHTYKVTGVRAAGGTGTCTVQASSTAPMQMVIHDVGSA